MIVFFKFLIRVYLYAATVFIEVLIIALLQINWYSESLSLLSHGIGNWENSNEISMPTTALNRLRLYCIATTIQRRTKNLGNWLIFPRWQRKLFRDVDVKRACKLFLRCTTDATPCLYSQWSDFVNRGQCNLRRQYVWVRVHVYLHYYGFCELSGSANLSEVTTTYLFGFYFFLFKVLFRHNSYHVENSR